MVFEERSYPLPRPQARRPIRFPDWVEKLAQEAYSICHPIASESTIHRDPHTDSPPPKSATRQPPHESSQDSSQDQERILFASTEMFKSIHPTKTQTQTSPFIKSRLSLTDLNGADIRRDSDEADHPSRTFVVDNTQSSRQLMTASEPPSEPAEDHTQHLIGGVTGHPRRSHRIAQSKRVLDISNRMNKIVGSTGFR